jgi:hypothetical protein
LVVRAEETVTSTFYFRKDSFEQIHGKISSMAQKLMPWEVTTSELCKETNMQFSLVPNLLG